VDLPYMEQTLAQDVSATMDVVSEHSYAELARPEVTLPARTVAVRSLLARSGGEKPLWHTEQGVGADGDGYLALPLSEAEGAALYTRNFVVARSLGIRKYFWFSAQTSPLYGWGVFYQDYIPRPRLVALNACASFLEGTTFQRSYRFSRHASGYLFAGAAPVCVVWNLDAPASLSLPLPPAAVEAFDGMGNPAPVTAGRGGSQTELPAARPVFLRLRPADGGRGAAGALERMLAGARVTVSAPVAVAAKHSRGQALEVIVTNRTPDQMDGVVRLVAPSGAIMAVSHFHSLPAAQTRTVSFAIPAAQQAAKIRVLCGDREMQAVEIPLRAPRRQGKRI
jgi:hypothetical protein